MEKFAHVQSPKYMSIKNSLVTHGSLPNEIKTTIHHLGQPISREQVANEVEGYIGSPILKDFFNSHPTVWFDLIRVVYNSTFREGNLNVEFNTKKEDDLYNLFLIRGRKADIGSKIQQSIKSDIIGNPSFLRFCSHQGSFLDQGSYIFEHLESGHIKNIVKSMLVRGLIDNIDGCNFDNINSYLPQILPKIALYLPQVFGKAITLYDEFKSMKTLDEVVSSISQSLQNRDYRKYGSRRVDIMRLIQAFHAWGNINKIEEAQANAMEYAKPENMKHILKKAKMTLEEYQVEHKQDGILYKGKIRAQGKLYEIVWRPKSMKSILHKLWETPEYTNVDALRDTLGITIICEDNATDTEIVTVLNNITELMPNYGYVIKDKGLLPKNYTIPKNNRRKQPLHITSKRGATTDKNLQNISVGGFTQLEEGKTIACGTEVQIIRRSAYEWKKKEDAFYKIKGLLQLLCRGEYFITPNNLLGSLEELISHTKLRSINEALEMISNGDFKPLKSIEELIVFLIHKNILTAYINEKMEILYTPKEYEAGFEKIMDTNIWKRYNTEGLKYFSPSTPSSSSPPPSPGRGFVMDSGTREKLGQIVAATR